MRISWFDPNLAALEKKAILDRGFSNIDHLNEQ
jgi:hypothetical protein